MEGLRACSQNILEKAKFGSLVFPPFPSKVLHIIFLAAFLYFSLPLPTLHSAQVTLAWDASAGPSIAGYIVYYGHESGSYTYAKDVGKVTSCTVANLQEGTPYYFAVTAYDHSGQESDYSKEVSNDIPGTCTYRIPQTSPFIKQSGGTGAVSLTTQAGCAWTAVSNASWILITSNSSGVGKAKVHYSVLPNDTPSTSRSGTITIAGQSFKVIQGNSKKYFSTEPVLAKKK